MDEFETRKNKENSNTEGAYAWVVLAATCVANTFQMSFFRVFGVLFVRFLEEFEAPTSYTSTIMGVAEAAYSLTTILVMGVWLDYWSIRRFALLGSCMCAFGVAISAFAMNVQYLLFSQGILVGCGMGVSYGPSLVLLGKYFKERFGFAVAISNVGISVGLMIMPQITTYCLNNYGLRGTQALLGGVMAQAIICSALYRDPEESEPTKTFICEDIALQDLKRQHYNNSKTCSQDDLLKGEQDLEGKLNHIKNSIRTDTILSYADKQKTHESPTNSQTVTTGHHQTHDQQNKCPYQQQEHQQQQQQQEQHQQQAQHYQQEKDQQFNTHIDCVPPFDNDRFETASLRSALMPSSTDLTHLPGVEKVVLHSNFNIYTMSSNPSITVLAVNTSHFHVLAGQSKRKAFTSKLRSMLDLSIFKNSMFWIIVGYWTFARFGCKSAESYLPALAIEKGLSEYRSSLLLTITGGLEILVRISVAFIVYLKLIKEQYICITSVFLLGLIFEFVDYFNSFTGMIVVVCAYAFAVGAVISLMGSVMADVVGPENFAKVYGFVQIFSGTVSLLLYPTLGGLKDATGSYVASYQLIGACMFLGGVSLALEKMVRWCVASNKTAIEVHSVDCAEENNPITA